MKLVIPNAREITEDESDTSLLGVTSDVFSIQERQVVETSSTRAGGQSQVIDVSDEDYVEITLSDGTQWYLGAEEREELLQAQAVGTRGVGGDELVLDEFAFSTGASRGLISNMIKRVKVFALNLAPTLGDEAADLASEQFSSVGKDQLSGLVIDPVAYTMARKLEKKLATKGHTRLCQVVSTGKTAVELQPLNPDELHSLLDDDAPTLLLLHGTLSSTEGSFGKLWQTRPEEYQQLTTYYDKRIIALEHCTLTESPIDNALVVAEALPAKARLHLLSHSRGGLIGELLCRGSRVGESAFSPDEIDLFIAQQESGRRNLDLSSRLFDALKKHFRNERENLERLNKVLSSRELIIDRFVRVGCPARGTTLASGKLHRWSNRAFNAVGLLGGQSINPVYQAFKTFTLGVLKSNTKAEVLPGLQAQMPSSALIHTLNNSDADVPADLSVVAGDIDITDRWNWKKVPLWLTDRFFGGDNDLVVNTASMDGGARREGGIVSLRVVGDHVNHFSYFSNADSATQLVKRLTGVASPRFELITRPDEVYIPRSTTPRHEGNRPALLLIPGILGSELNHNDKRIWVHATNLLRGRIKRIGIEHQPPVVSAPAVLDRAYGAFVQACSQDHDVFVCPYDWRLSLTESAKILASRVQELIDLQEHANDIQPIRIVAHSMGGLVTRMMIANHPETWRAIASRPGSRFLMAGTPTNGSYSINRIFAGEAEMIKLLAFADLKNSKRDIVNLVTQFPGVATMLPGFGELEWLQESTWQAVEDSASGKHWATAANELLSSARRERQTLLDTPLDPELVGYVAGESDKTVADAFFDDAREGEVCFVYTGAGDGQVTWDAGIPTGLPNVWYQPSVHGSLLDDAEYFEAWSQLLNTGKTSLLPRSPSGKRLRSATLTETWVEADTDVLDFLPDNNTLLALALGMELPGRKKARAQTAVLNVTVAHGDLAFAQYPVTVGHYEGDSIVAAEKALDRVLDYRLSQRHHIGQYPGEVGTCEVVFARSGRFIPEGAVVVGLGQLGELSTAKLERTLTSGIVKYIIEFNDWWSTQSQDRRPPVVGLSSLLIGSGTGSLSVRDSVGVLLRAAAAANKTFQDSQFTNLYLLEQLEIVEIWQDLALQTADAAYGWSTLIKDVDVAPELKTLDGGLRRSRFAASPEWWHTINVKLSDDKTQYIYDDYTRYARNELSREPIDREFIDRFLEKIINTTRYDRNATSSPHKALFELLLPRSIKQQSPDSDKLLLVLDKATARIPWEMLIDGWSAKKEPLALSKTIIRRLSLESYRHRPEPAAGNEAFVVGDPPSGSDPYPVLPGARQEANSVARQLQVNRQYEVTTCISDDNTDSASADPALKIIESLYSREFRILHFAGHGAYYRETGDAVRDADDEGMVIGEGLRLTPALINKMPKTPALVFLNCCHLGYTEQRNESTTVRYNHIAANLATQFIMLGTKVVIAAGWEVNDGAAKRFADVFYDNILANHTLSYSIKQAREITFQDFPESNTFGAYQCWGDPEFRLNPRKPSGGSAVQSLRFVSPYECEIEALNIRNQARSASADDCAGLTRRAEELLAFIQKTYGDPWTTPDIRSAQWSRENTRVLAKLGRAYGEIGELEQSIRLLRAASRLNATALSVHDLEHLGNLECRCALKLHLGRMPESTDAASELGSSEKLLETGKSRLERLLAEYKLAGQTSGLREIHCLLGSAAKREVQLLGNRATRSIARALLEMRHYYGIGWAGELQTSGADADVDDYVQLASLNQEEPDLYAFMNFALAAVIVRWYDIELANPLPKSLAEQVSVISAKTRQAMRRDDSFWVAMHRADTLLLQYLDASLRDSDNELADDAAYIDVITRIYEDTQRRFGSMRQWATVQDHLGFIEKLIENVPNKAKAKPAAGVLDGIRKLQQLLSEQR